MKDRVPLPGNSAFPYKGTSSSRRKDAKVPGRNLFDTYYNNE